MRKDKNWILRLINFWAVQYMSSVGFILYSDSGSAPAADPLIGQAAAKNSEIAGKALDFYTNEYEKYRPQMEESKRLAAEVTQQQLDSSKTNANLAQDYSDYQKNTFRPLEKQLVDSATAYDTTGRQDAEASKGVADVHQAFDSAKATSARNNERMGVNPTSGNAESIQAGLDTNEAIASANAANKGRLTAESTGRAMVADAANLGRGLASNQATSTQIASTQAGKALDANATGNAATLQGLNIQGQGYQTGIQGNQSAANILNTQYNGQLQANAQNNASDANTMSGLGTIAGIGASFLAEGGLVNPGLGDEEAPEGNTIDNETGELVHPQGVVNGAGTEVSDSIPARLSKKEYVLNAGAVKIVAATLGLDALDNLNKRGLSLRSAT
jgi:hypothetical protein